MRRKFAVLTLLIILLSIIVMAKELEATVNPERPDRYTLHEVQRGESLWKISKRYMKGIDPRLGIQWIREANNLPRDYILQPGDLLNVPDENGALTEPYGQD